MPIVGMVLVLEDAGARTRRQVSAGLARLGGAGELVLGEPAAHRWPAVLDARDEREVESRVERLRGVPGVAAYRLVQTERRRFDVAIMPDGDVDPRLIEERCGRLLGADSQIDVRLTEEIRPEASNKFRFVYSAQTPKL